MGRQPAAHARRCLGALLMVVLAWTTAACGGNVTPSSSSMSPPDASSSPARSGGPGAATGSPTGSAGPITIPTLAKVGLDADRAVHAHVGRLGGAVEAVDARGTIYRLVVPSGSFATTTEILIAPITTLSGLPDGAGLAAGVHLLPEGLVFPSAAELTITLPSAPANGVLPVGYRGDLAEPFRYPTHTEGTQTTYGITHFSGYALLTSTDAAISAAELGLTFPWDEPSDAADAALAQIAAVLDAPSAQGQATIDAAMRHWLSPTIENLVRDFEAQGTWDAAGTFAALRTKVVHAFAIWNYVEVLLLLQGFVLELPIVAEERDLAVRAATHGFSTTNSHCAASETGELMVFRVYELPLWQVFAKDAGIADRDPSFAPAYLTDHACVQVEYAAEGQADFSGGVPGETGTLQVAAGVRIDGSELRVGGGGLQVHLTSDDTIPGLDEIAETDAAGRVSRTITWDAGSPELRVDIATCLLFLPQVCATTVLIRGAAVATNPPGTCPSFQAGAATGTTWDGARSGDGASIGGDMVTSIGVVNGRRVVSGAGRWVVDAASVGSGPQTVSITWAGQLFWRGGGGGSGGSVRVTVGVNGASTTHSFAAPGASPTAITLDRPVTVRDGDVILITFSADVSAADTTNDLVLTGSLDFGTPDRVSIIQGACPG